MAAQDVQMPLFGKAGNTNGEGWGESDGFDVDMLTEFLLNDGALNANGVTFDFSMDSNQMSAAVSPENSEDGVLPTVADTNTNTAVEKAPTIPTLQSYVAGQVTTPAISGSIPAVPAATTNALPTIAPTPLTAPGMTPAPMVFASQQANTVVAKRQRTEDGSMPVMAVAGAVYATEQLAAAAAQAFQNPGRGRKKSQAQIDRRRERNRILARRTRLRKKFFFESLQKDILDLQRENLVLKEIVKMNIGGDEGSKILEGCNAAEKVPPAVLEACGEEGGMESQDFNLVKSIQKSQHSFVITDPSLQDNPIVFASDDFLKLTGYTREQVLGRNCRFLQGTETSQTKLETLRKCLTAGEDVSVVMVNYTADGSPFWNKLFIAALRDAQNNIVNFIGVIVKVAGPEPGDPEYVSSQNNNNDNDNDDNEDTDDLKDVGAPEDTIKALEGDMEMATAAAP